MWNTIHFCVHVNYCHIMSILFLCVFPFLTWKSPLTKRDFCFHCISAWPNMNVGSEFISSLIVARYLIYQCLSSNVSIITSGLGVFSSPLALNQLIPLNMKSIWNSFTQKLNSIHSKKNLSRNSPFFWHV